MHYIITVMTYVVLDCFVSFNGIVCTKTTTACVVMIITRATQYICLLLSSCCVCTHNDIESVIVTHFL